MARDIDASYYATFHSGGCQRISRTSPEHAQIDQVRRSVP
jgi:hypothetical protein